MGNDSWYVHHQHWPQTDVKSRAGQVNGVTMFKSIMTAHGQWKVASWNNQNDFNSQSMNFGLFDNVLQNGFYKLQVSVQNECCWKLILCYTPVVTPCDPQTHSQGSNYLLHDDCICSASGRHSHDRKPGRQPLSSSWWLSICWINDDPLNYSVQICGTRMNKNKMNQ